MALSTVSEDLGDDQEATSLITPTEAITAEAALEEEIDDAKIVPGPFHQILTSSTKCETSSQAVLIATI